MPVVDPVVGRGGRGWYPSPGLGCVGRVLWCAAVYYFVYGPGVGRGGGVFAGGSPVSVEGVPGVPGRRGGVAVCQYWFPRRGACERARGDPLGVQWRAPWGWRTKCGRQVPPLVDDPWLPLWGDCPCPWPGWVELECLELPGWGVRCATALSGAPGCGGVVPRLCVLSWVAEGRTLRTWCLPFGVSWVAGGRTLLALWLAFGGTWVAEGRTLRSGC